MLSAKNQEKFDKAKEIFNSKNIIYEEKANGQINVDKISFWSTTDRWYDPMTGNKGYGINSLLMYLEEKNKPKFTLKENTSEESIKDRMNLFLEIVQRSMKTFELALGIDLVNKKLVLKDVKSDSITRIDLDDLNRVHVM